MTAPSPASRIWRLIRTAAVRLAGADDEPSDDGIRRIFAAVTFLWAAPILFVFGTADVSVGHYVLGGWTIMTGIVASASMPLVRRSAQPRNIYRVNLFLVGVLLLAFLATSPPDGARALWWYVYPLATFFLLGGRDGLWFAGSTAVGMVAVLFGPLAGGVAAGYTVGFRVRFVTAYIVVAGMTFCFDTVRVHILAQLNREKENLEEAKRAAEAASGAKSQFLANMSHELRTPLNHIIGFTQLVADEHLGPLNTKQREPLHDVLDSSTHLLLLIDDILDLSKVEAGRLDIELSDISLQAFLDHCLTMFKEEAGKRHIRLTAEYGELPAEIQSDERKLKQVVYNLISNATKFTPDGGTVCLRARTAAAARSDGSPARPPSSRPWLQITVEDTGVGLTPEHLETVFGSFEQIGTSRGRRVRGTGLGLSLTRSLVEVLEGRIWAESDGPGKGSRFNVMLPFHPVGGVEVS